MAALWLAAALLAGCATRGGVGSVFDPADANWIGRWESDQYPRISGSLYLKISDPIPVGKEFRVTGVSINHTTLGGLLDERYDVILKATFDPNGTLKVVDSRGNPLLNEGANVQLRGSIRGTDIKPRYAARLGEDGELLGRYNADRPYDVGEFWLVRGRCEAPCGEVPERSSLAATAVSSD